MSDATLAAIESAFVATLGRMLHGAFMDYLSPAETDEMLDVFRRILAERLARVPPESPDLAKERGEMLAAVRRALHECERKLRAGVPANIAMSDCIDSLTNNHLSTLF